jgi:hypothetical protein
MDEHIYSGKGIMEYLRGYGGVHNYGDVDFGEIPNSIKLSLNPCCDIPISHIKQIVNFQKEASKMIDPAFSPIDEKGNVDYFGQYEKFLKNEPVEELNIDPAVSLAERYLRLEKGEDVEEDYCSCGEFIEECVCDEIVVNDEVDDEIYDDDMNTCADCEEYIDDCTCEW